MLHMLYDKKEILVKNILDPINMTNPSSKNFANIKNKERLDRLIIKYRTDEFAKNADSKNQKNKGLDLKVDFELEDQRILWLR